MLRKMNNRAGKLLKSAVLAGILGFGVSQASANIVFDLRAVGANATGSKSVTIAGPGEAVQLEVWASIQNLDSSRTNDGFQTLNAGIMSVEGPGGLFGNVSPVTFNTDVLDTSLSAPGTPTDLDGNAADLELGSTTASTAAGWFIANTGVSTKFGTGSGTGSTDFLLGTLSWNSSGAPAGGTDLNLFIRPKTDGLVSARQMVKYTTDGTVKNVVYNDPSISLGAPVNVAIPEPASLGILAMAAVGLMGRRRKA